MKPVPRRLTLGYIHALGIHAFAQAYSVIPRPPVEQRFPGLQINLLKPIIYQGTRTLTDV